MKPAQIQELLEELGFGQNEAKVYLSLIQSGQAKAGKIIDDTSLHRHIVYESLKALEERHVISSTKKNNVSLFQAVTPTVLLDQYESRRKILEEAVKDLQTKHVAAKPEVVSYEGAQGPETVLKEMLAAGQNGDEVFGIDPNEDMFLQTIPEALDEYFKTQESMKEPMKEKILFREGFESPNKTAEIKHLPKQFFTPLTLNIYGDKVALTDFVDPITTMIIKKQSIADGFKEYFNMLWNQDVKVYRGKEGVQEVMEASLQHKDMWYIGGNAGIGQVMPEYWNDYNRRRIENGCWMHDLVDTGTYLEGIQELPPGEKDKERFYEFKWLPEEVSSPSVIFMYGDRVAHIIWEAQPEPIAFVIDNKELFNSYRKYFDYLWNQDIRVLQGLDNIKDLFYEKMRALKKGEEYQVMWGTYGAGVKQEMVDWFTDYHVERTERGVRLRLYGYEEDRESVMKEMSTPADPERELVQLRFAPTVPETPMQINIYPDSVVLFRFSPGQEAIAIEITRQEVRDAMLVYFENMWQQDISVTHGLEAAQEVFYRKMRELESGDEYGVLWGTYGKETRKEMVPWFVEYNTERIKRGVVLNAILFEEDRTVMTDEMKQAGDPELQQTSIRYISKHYGSPMQINIYPDSVAMFYWALGEEAVAIEINRKDIRDAMQQYFTGVWESAKE